jgi:hypothetical protein
MKSYSKRTWLNDPEKESTGSVVCFSGLSSWIGAGNTKPPWTRFIEIADCRRKITLHQSDTDSDKEYIEKIEILLEEITQYLGHLKMESNQDKEG